MRIGRFFPQVSFKPQDDADGIGVGGDSMDGIEDSVGDALLSGIDGLDLEDSATPVQGKREVVDDAGDGSVIDPEDKSTNLIQNDDVPPPKEQQTDAAVASQIPSADDILAATQPQLAAKLTFDKQGNVVDAKGNVLARTGKERRLYEDAHNSKFALGQAQQQLGEMNGIMVKAQQLFAALKAENTTLKEAQNAGNAQGLSAQEQAEAMELYSRGKSDPITIVKELLTRASQSGYDLGEFNQGVPFDLKSLTDGIVGQIKPLVEPFSVQQQQTSAHDQAVADARKEASEFLGRNPGAVPYADTIATMVGDESNRFGNPSMNEAWLMIQNYLLQHGQRQPTSPGSPENNRTGGPSIPQGQGPREVRASSGKLDMTPVDPKKSYKEIGREVFSELGIKV